MARDAITKHEGLKECTENWCKAREPKDIHNHLPPKPAMVVKAIAEKENGRRVHS